MRYTQFFIPTLKETPSDAEVVSHQLMMRSGMIRKIAAGIYTYMPLGLRSIRKFEQIVREEMNRAGAIELLMPGVQPADSGLSLNVGLSMARNCYVLRIARTMNSAWGQPMKRSSLTLHGVRSRATVKCQSTSIRFRLNSATKFAPVLV